jgi:hypothetical protein
MAMTMKVSDTKNFVYARVCLLGAVFFIFREGA